MNRALCIGDPLAIDPHTVHAARASHHPRRTCWQVIGARAGAAPDSCRIEEHQVGSKAFTQCATPLDAEESGLCAGQPTHCLGHRHGSPVTHPMAEQMQPEPGVVQEGQVRAGIRQ